MKIRKKRIKLKILIIIFITFFCLVLSILFINFYSKKASPIIINSAEPEIKRLMFLVINNSVDEIIENNDINDIFTIRYNNSGDIILIDFDSRKSSIILNKIINLVEFNMKNISDGNVDKYDKYYDREELELLKDGIITKVPFGIVFNVNYLNNLGPKIPIKLSYVRDLEVNFSTDVVEYGINNALLKLNINIKANVRIILPIISDNIEVNFIIPVTMKILQGSIPSYYIDGFNKKSNIVKES